MREESKIDGFGRRLRNREFQLGATVSSTDVAVAEAMAGSALDFIMLDTEHSPIGPEMVQTLVMAAHGAGTPVLVRVGGLEPIRLMQPLDVGAAGVIVPRVRNADEVRWVVEHTRYPPVGLRGFGPRRAGGYGRTTAEYVAGSSDNVGVVVQIETADAVANLAEIASVPGLDGLLVGPNDLSAALGVPGQTDGALVRDVMRQVVEVCQDAGLAAGTATMPATGEVQRVQRFGWTFVVAGVDLFYMVDALDSFLADVTEAFAESEPDPESR